MNKTNNDILTIWWHNKSVNPHSKRTIKEGGVTYNKLLKESLKNNVMKDSYNDYHNKYIDPLMHMEISKGPNIYSYKNCWDPLNGYILGRDYRGPLYFDPDVLIHYFYTKRLNHLWVKSDEGYSGTYGDALGNGPDFFVPGRGNSQHWYLFRLPLFDAYCDNTKIGQQITLGPILDEKEIKKIYNKALKKKTNYKKLFGKKRPNLILMYEIYHQAIRKYTDEEYSNLLSAGFSDGMIKQQFNLANMNAVDKLKKFI